MPSTIPYDSSLMLTSIVEQRMLENLSAVAKAQMPSDIAQDTLNHLLATKRNLEMTKAELAQLAISTPELDASIATLDENIAAATQGCMAAKIKSQNDVQKLKQTRSSIIGSQVESPVDYVKSAIKSMPLGPDTLNMDVQYFSLGSNGQDSTAVASRIGVFVSGAMSYLGADASASASTRAQKQMVQQYANHDVVGTIVLAVTCTHKNANVLAPFILNVDKAIKAWNHLFPAAEDKIVPTSAASMTNMTKADPLAEGKKFSIVSGMTYGSSFVGMVHILNSTSMQTSERVPSIVAYLQAQTDAGSWFRKASGRFEVDTTFSNQVKSLLSTQNIASRVTLISMGVIPSNLANTVQLGVGKFDRFDPQSSVEQIATIQNATSSDQDSVRVFADAARTGRQLIDTKARPVTAALSTPKETDDTANRIFDINSMMTALEDYLKKASEGNSGVPINLYLKDITKTMLVELWVAKYYPGKYMAILSDDDAPTSPADTTELAS